MKSQNHQSGFLTKPFHSAIAILCAASLAPGTTLLLAQQTQDQPPPDQTAQSQDQAAQPQDQAVANTPDAPPVPADQLDSLVAPIALYPDSLLSQTLVASTYPLEIIQLQQWLGKNKELKDKALQSAVMKQNWDPSIQSMAAFPDVVKRLADDIQWTTDLGNAFLAQQNDVMDAVQRMRAKAEGTGNLKTTKQMKVDTQSVEGGKQVIVIEQASPDVVYVPTYNPTVVYGAPAYPYPPLYYPPPGYYAAGLALSFTAGVILGNAWSGGWGYHCGWGNGSININNNNNFVHNTNINSNINRNTNINRGSNNTWQHNPQHRGGAPYPNRGTANRFGGGGSGTARPGAGGIRPGGGGGGTAVRPGGGAGVRPGGSGGGTAIRPGGGAGVRPGAGGGGTAVRPGGGAGTRPGSGGGGRPSGGDRIGNRSVSPGGGGFGGNKSAFGGGGMSGGAARQSSGRGAASFGGGGGGRAGGGRRR